MQLDIALLSRRPDLGEPLHLPRRRHEARVSLAAVTASGQDDARAGMREVGDQVAVVGEHLRPDGDVHLDVTAVGAVLARAAAVLAARRLDPAPALQRSEVAKRRVRDERDVSPTTAVAAVRTALRDVLLPPEAEPAVAALAGLDVDPGPVAEHGELLRGVLDDRHEAALAARAERDRAGAGREDRVVAADQRAGAGAELRAALPDDDVARLRRLAVEHLHAEVLGVRIAAVLGGAETFLMCHYASSFALSADWSAEIAPLRAA